MANYTKTTNFTSKDSLSTGNPLKIIRGSEHDTEYSNIATAIQTKADTVSPALTGTATAVNLTVSGTLLVGSDTATSNTATQTLTNKTLTSPTINGGTITGITDLTVADGGTGASTFTTNAVLLGNGTSSFQTIAPSTSGNVLTSNGTTWSSQAPAASGGFDAGTRMMFAQTSAPTGWTKDTTNYNNYAIRVVTGTASTGGSVDFTTAFASGLSDSAVTLSTAQMPAHTHSYTVVSVTANVPDGFDKSPFIGTTSATTGSQGGGGSHAHTLPSFAVKYLDVITATKN